MTTLNSTFLIKSQKNQSFGTAFCIQKDAKGVYLLTCKHVVESCGKDDLEVKQQKALVCSSLEGNDLIDLAVVYVEGLEAKAFNLTLMLLPKESAFTIDGFKPHKSGEYKQEKLEGSIKKISQIQGDGETIESYELLIGKDDSIEKGYSGSAIVSKRSGQVVAVATDRTTTGKHAYAIPLKYLQEVWEDLDTSLFDTIIPFVGLSSFSRKDRAYFFGRDKETAEILKQLENTSILAVIGDSGSGKSSLVKAGVIPNYIDNSNNKNFHVIEIRPARNPFVELARCVGDICEKRNSSEADIGYFVDKIKSQEPQSIHAVFERLFKEENSELLFYIDQFEELFTLCTEDIQQKFIESILYLIENQTAYLEIKVLFSMRRDYYNLLRKYEVFYQNIDNKTYLVRRMSDEKLKEVIERPLEMLSVEQSEIEQLSNTILWDIGDEAKEITLLQIALTETWSHKAEYEHDLLETYVKIGRVTGALSHLATNAMKSLSEKDQELFKYIFVRIVKFNDMGGITRRLADRDEFSDEAWELVQKLASVHGAKQTEQKEIGRLLKLKSSDENQDEEVIELIHEALTTQWDTYVEWIKSVNTENRKRIHNVLIAKSKVYKKNPQRKFLLSGYALEEGRKLLDKEYFPYLSVFEKEFIEKSEKSEARTVFWKRFGVGTLVVLLGLSGYLGFEANRAKERAEEVSEKLLQVVTDFGDMSIENHVKNDPNAFKMFSFIVEHFKKSENNEILNVVATSYAGMGMAYGNKKEYDKAIEAYEKAVEINPQKDEAYYNMGSAYGNKKEYDKAIEAYEKAVEINPKDDEAYYNMGNAYGNKKEYDKAIEAYQKAVEINPQKDEAYYNMGIAYANKKEYDKAIEAYEKAVEINPKDDGAYNNMGIAYGNKKEYDKAIEAYQKAVEINPQKDEAYYNMGIAYGNKKEYDKAIEAYQKAVDINPQKDEAYYNMGNTYGNKKEYDKATEAYKEAITINPKYDKAYNNMGSTYDDKGEYDKAIEAYQKAIEINPKDDDAYNNMGSAYDDKGEYDKAIEAYQKAIEINPKRDDAYYNMGVVYGNKKEYDKAIEAYQKAIEINPKDDDAYYNMGVVYENKKEYDKSIKAYQKAIIINPKNDYVYNAMGMTYFWLEKFDEAIASYIQAIKLNPTDSLAYSNLFELQLTQNQPFTQKLEQKYIELFEKKKEIFISYEMLKILQNIAQNKEANIEQWKEKYKRVKLDWSFNELNSWIAKMEEGETKRKLKEALVVFEGHLEE